MDRMLLVLGPSDEAQPQILAFLDSQQDKHSSNYHKWITPEQFGERFGPSQQDVKTITSWLELKGFNEIKVARGRGSIEFSGSARQVHEAFVTEMRYYQSNGETHVANGSDISIPRAISRIVRGATLENFSFTRPNLKRLYPLGPRVDGKLAPIAPEADFGSGHFLAPGDFAKIYDLSSLYGSGVNGTGITIAVTARSNLVLSDVEAFRQAFNLPANDPRIIVNGQDPGPLLGPEMTEASLDAEWSGAIAPNANIDVVVSASTATTDGVMLSAMYIVDNDLADIMSVSFSSCEHGLGALNSFFSALYQQAAAEGISVLVASGDDGAAECDASNDGSTPAQGGLAVNGLASTPFNTAVGGTQFAEGSNPATYWGNNGPGQVSVLGYIPEGVWNESCDPTKATCVGNRFHLDAGGGGVSAIYSKPSWQSTALPGVPSDNQRDVPDVSFTAALHDGYLICVALTAPCATSGSGSQTQLASAGMVGGTSASVQAFAGIMALVDQQQGGRQGLANYVLYKLAGSESFSNCNSSNRTDPTQPAPSGCVFNDITSGNNGVPGNDTLSGTVPPGDVDGQLGYNALPGYDSAVGLGSVDVANLMKAWNSANFQGSTTTLAASGTTSVQHGQPISFNINVSPAAGSGVPAGPFVLIAKNAPQPFTGAAVGGGTLTAGAFSGAFTSLPGGQYNVVARYGGDGVFGGSESNPVAVDISNENSSVSLSGTDQNNNPFTAPASITLGYGLAQPLQINVTAISGKGIATGTVSLLDDGIKIAQLPLNNGGQVTFINCDPFSAPFCLALGQHTITAVYQGDASLTPSSSPALVISVVKGPALFGAIFGCCVIPQTVELLADFETGQAILGTPPTGTVSFTDTLNGTTSSLGTPVSLAEGPRIVRFFDVAPGTHTLAVQYSGDNNYLPSTITSQALVIPTSALLPTQTTLKVLTNPMIEGQPVTFQVTVTSSASSAVPTGNVDVLAGPDFVDGFTRHTLVNGSVTYQAIMPNANPVVQAIYAGDSTFNSSSSAPLVTGIAKITAPLGISSNVQTLEVGSQVSLIATITPPAGTDAPRGMVQFYDSLNSGPAVPLGLSQQVLADGQAGGPGGVSIAVATIPAVLPSGVHTITASYSGDLNYSAVAQSKPLGIAVVVGPLPVFGLTTSPGGNTVTISSGQTAHFNVTLNGNGFFGPISLSCQAPAGVACFASPTQVDLNNVLTSTNIQLAATPSQSAAAPARGLPFFFAAFLGLAFLVDRRTRHNKSFLLTLSVGLILSMGACGGGQSAPPPPPPPKSFTLTLSAANGTTTTSIPLTLTVTQ